MYASRSQSPRLMSSKRDWTGAIHVPGVFFPESSNDGPKALQKRRFDFKLCTWHGFLW